MANKAIQIVNPDIEATVYKDLGGDYDDEGIWQPNYEISTIKIQRQQLTQNDILFLNQLEFQGTYEVIYVHGFYDGVDRLKSKSPDIFDFDDERWKVLHVPEHWDNWSRLILCQQEQSPTD